MEQLQPISTHESCAIYEIAAPADAGTLRRLVVSTPETRAICNDPTVVGVDFSQRLRTACSRTLVQLGDPAQLSITESSTTVLHILRGGLTFGLREALYSAYGWNSHGSAFISAQRMRHRENSEDWYISENTYQKVQLPKNSSIVCGDYVATGTSLQFALQQLLTIVEDEGRSISSITFFTIGGPRAEIIMHEMDMACRNRFPRYERSTLIYLEGRFEVASADTPLRIKVTGTDLLRSNSLLAPEFLESQYENPANPLQRCVTYDAGSRAFWLPEYYQDVSAYWTQTASLAEQGVSFEQLLQERFPELDAKRFGAVDLRALAERQLELCSIRA